MRLNDRWLSVEEIAEHLGVSRDTVYTWVNEKRKALFDAQDEIDRKKEALIGEIEAKLKQSVEVQEIFTIRWRVA